MQSDVNFPLVLCKPTSQIIQPKFNQCKRFVLHPHFSVIYLTISILGSSIIFLLSLKYTLRFVPSTKIHFFIETAKNFWIFLSKRRKRKSMGTTWCLFPFLEFLLQFPIFVVSGRNQRYRHKKRQVPNCLGICLNHLWEMII